MEFNSGVYLAAIKPVLSSVKVGWKTEVGNWCISCTKLSNRNDNVQLHLLCTQLTFLMQDKNNSDISHQAMVHLYHTADKIQLQGSTIISRGVSSASWLAKNLIEPLVSRHIQANHQQISEINSSILSNHTYTCSKCAHIINPSSTQPKDLPLTCRKCGKIFHKKCSDKKGSRSSSWQRDPWYCPTCIMTPAMELQPATPGQIGARLVSYIPSTSAMPQVDDPDNTGVIPTPQPRSPCSPETNQEAETSHLIPIRQDNPTDTATLPPCFPSNAIRQRGSNIAINDPEKEFQRTALDSCRSTIANQEADLRTLRESLYIRNKRIIQLEGQVSHAAKHIADIPSQPSEGPSHSISETKILQSLSSLHTKIDSYLKTPVPANNININNSHSWLPYTKKIVEDKCAQAELCSQANDQPVLNGDTPPPTTVQSSDQSLTHTSLPPSSSDMATEHMDEGVDVVLTCTTCGESFETINNLHMHIESQHGQISERCSQANEQNYHTCKKCEIGFEDANHLKEHEETIHVQNFLYCTMCDYKCKTQNHLNYHMVSCHDITSTVDTFKGKAYLAELFRQIAHYLAEHLIKK